MRTGKHAWKRLSPCLAHDTRVVNHDSLVLITVNLPRRFPLDATQTGFSPEPLSHRWVEVETVTFSIQRRCPLWEGGGCPGLLSPHCPGPHPWVTLAMPPLELSPDGSQPPSPGSASPRPLPRPPARFFFPRAPAISKPGGGFLVYFI